jgi:8-oxo-dGTP pyrophosphatase MutT (NUDIX family)
VAEIDRDTRQKRGTPRGLIRSRARVNPVHHSLDDLVAHLSRRLREPLPGPDAQRRFAPLPLIDGWSPEQTPGTARRAAVLLLIYPGHAGPTIPLTVRPTTLPTHGGQVSLPGGAIGVGESIDAAALREAEEEIGIDPASVHVLGPLSTLWIPISNFVITPVVGITRQPPAFRLHEREVDAVIEMPMDRLLDRASITWSHRQRGDTRLDYPCFDIGGPVVWGATAMVLSEFACLFDPMHGPAPRASGA